MPGWLALGAQSCGHRVRSGVCHQVGHEVDFRRVTRDRALQELMAVLWQLRLSLDAFGDHIDPQLART